MIHSSQPVKVDVTNTTVYMRGAVVIRRPNELAFLTSSTLLTLSTDMFPVNYDLDGVGVHTDEDGKPSKIEVLVSNPDSETYMLYQSEEPFAAFSEVENVMRLKSICSLGGRVFYLTSCGCVGCEGKFVMDQCDNVMSTGYEITFIRRDIMYYVDYCETLEKLDESLALVRAETKEDDGLAEINEKKRKRD